MLLFFSGFLGFANVYAMRVNLSVAIVYMSGEKNMDWDESKQGFILGDLDFILYNKAGLTVTAQYIETISLK